MGVTLADHDELGLLVEKYHTRIPELFQEVAEGGGSSPCLMPLESWAQGTPTHSTSRVFSKAGFWQALLTIRLRQLDGDDRTKGGA